MADEMTAVGQVVAEWAADWKREKWFQLAGHADCATPKGSSSAGADFLVSVRDAAVEAVECVDLADYGPEDLARIADDLRDCVHEIADAAPDVYTPRRWAEFVDLAAWQEDPTELGFDGSDMEAAAGVCLYIIAERLAEFILSDLAKTYGARLDDDRTVDGSALPIEWAE